jgi:hypothetical protein
VFFSFVCFGAVVSDVYCLQAPPHPNKQIKNTTQDNKRQTPPCCVFDLFVWACWCLTFIVLCCVIDLYVWMWWCLTFIVLCCVIDLFVWVWWCHPNKQINNTTQDNKRQTPPHPNKQIKNTTQDNKRQTPPHQNKQIKNTTQENKRRCGGVLRLLSCGVLLICLFGWGGV